MVIITHNNTKIIIIDIQLIAHARNKINGADDIMEH